MFYDDALRYWLISILEFPDLYLFAGLKEQLQTYLDDDQVNQIERAYVFARDAHLGQQRSSGEPYITHPVAAAKILADYHLDPQSIMATLLHDVIEDCDVTKEDLKTAFGEQVAELVEGVSKLTQIKFRTKAEAQAENFRKMMMAMTKDIRVILIKLSDRLHNMRTLGALNAERRRRIAKETLEIYAPIALRIGMYSTRVELEDLGFASLYPMRYRVLKESVLKARGNRKEIINTILESVQKKLDESGLRARVFGREKELFSIYKKMRSKKTPFSEIMDVYGFRVVTENEDDCYRILGQLHSLYLPVPGRFKDYIAIPKANGYQSLHTTLKGPHGLHVEMQIRTETMEQMAENGVAAHWLYKSSQAGNPAEIKARDWMRNLMELQNQTLDPIEFIESVKVDLFPNEVFVFTPNGSIIELPLGATPVDFAYAIHTDVGNSCIACKINRQRRSLSSELRNGETVEIITAPGARPAPSWLGFVVTGKARANIRHYLKNLRRDEAINLGARLLQKVLGQRSLDDVSDDMKLKVSQQSKQKTFDDVLAEIGFGKLASVVVAHRLLPENTDDVAEHTNTEPLAIHGTEGMLVTLAKCCYPIPGDPIVGFVSSGSGLIVHRAECKNVNRKEQEDQFLSVEWESDPQGVFSAELQIETLNLTGVLANVAKVMADTQTNIQNIQLQNDDDSNHVMVFLVAVKDRIHLANIIKRIRKYSFVNRIQRLK